MTVVIDLNVVRLRTLREAVLHTRDAIAVAAQSRPPGGLDLDQSIRWGFMLGQAHVALTGILDIPVGGGALSALDTYRRARAELADVVRTARFTASHASDVAEGLAAELVVSTVEPILYAADRAPRWLRALGTRRRS